MIDKPKAGMIISESCEENSKILPRKLIHLIETTYATFFLYRVKSKTTNKMFYTSANVWMKELIF